MDRSTFSSFSSELEKVAVDAGVLASRVLRQGRVQDMTGRLTADAFRDLVTRGGAYTLPKVSQARALLRAGMATSAAEKTHAVRQMLDRARTTGGSTVLHPEILARFTQARTGVPLSKDGVRAVSGVAGAHEIAERRVLPKQVIGRYRSHLSPDVLVQEHNTLSRLTGAGAEEARGTQRALRASTGETAHLRNMMTEAFKDPRAAGYLAEGEKVPKAMRKALLRKLQEDPTLVQRTVPKAPSLWRRLMGMPDNLRRQLRMAEASFDLSSRFRDGTL